VTHPDDALETLAAAAAARRRLALAQAAWPWSRHAAFAGLLAALAAAQALPLPFNVVADGGIAFAAAGVAALDRRRRGVFVNGWRAGRTQGVALLAVLMATVLGLVGLWLSRQRGLVFAPLAVGVVLLPLGFAASRLWEHVYRRELEQAL
jgi:hypothetical protein